jgi:hypothetical protein
VAGEAEKESVFRPEEHGHELHHQGRGVAGRHADVLHFPQARPDQAQGPRAGVAMAVCVRAVPRPCLGLNSSRLRQSHMAWAHACVCVHVCVCMLVLCLRNSRVVVGVAAPSSPSKSACGTLPLAVPVAVPRAALLMTNNIRTKMYPVDEKQILMTEQDGNVFEVRAGHALMPPRCMRGKREGWLSPPPPLHSHNHATSHRLVLVLLLLHLSRPSCLCFAGQELRAGATRGGEVPVERQRLLPQGRGGAQQVPHQDPQAGQAQEEEEGQGRGARRQCASRPVVSQLVL